MCGPLKALISGCAGFLKTWKFKLHQQGFEDEKFGN